MKRVSDKETETRKRGLMLIFAIYLKLGRDFKSITALSDINNSQKLGRGRRERRGSNFNSCSPHTAFYPLSLWVLGWAPALPRLRETRNELVVGQHFSPAVLCVEARQESERLQ
jgi:hypothetical protein